MKSEHKPLNQVSKKKEVTSFFVDNSSIQNMQPDHLLFLEPPSP